MTSRMFDGPSPSNIREVIERRAGDGRAGASTGRDGPGRGEGPSLRAGGPSAGSVRSGGRDLERDRGARERLAHRARVLGLLGGRAEAGVVEPVDLTAHREPDRGDP